MARFAEDVALEARRSAAKRTVASDGDVVDKRVQHIAENAPSRASISPSSVLRLQRAVGNAGTTAFLQRDDLEQAEAAGASRSPVHDTIGSGGSPLDKGTRTEMEQHLGTDLSDVRLHVDRHSAESVQAAAYTVGNDVVVHPDHFQAGTPSAQRTLAHELTHVVQQRSGPVAGTEREGGIKVSDPSDRFEQEAEHSADGFMSSAQTHRASHSESGHASGTSVQRAQAEEEQPLQRLALQREDEGQESSSEEDVQRLSVQREEEEEESDSEG